MKKKGGMTWLFKQKEEAPTKISEIYSNIYIYIEIYRNIQKYTEISKTICSNIDRNIYRNMQKYTEIYRNIQALGSWMWAFE